MAPSTFSSRTPCFRICSASRWRAVFHDSFVSINLLRGSTHPEKATSVITLNRVGLSVTGKASGLPGSRLLVSPMRHQDRLPGGYSVENVIHGGDDFVRRALPGKSGRLSVAGDFDVLYQRFHRFAAFGPELLVGHDAIENRFHFLGNLLGLTHQVGLLVQHSVGQLAERPNDSLMLGDDGHRDRM